MEKCKLLRDQVVQSKTRLYKTNFPFEPEVIYVFS